MHKKIKNKQWLISYYVKEGKIIEVWFSAKGGILAGWCQRSLFLNSLDAV